MYSLHMGHIIITEKSLSVTITGFILIGRIFQIGLVIKLASLESHSAKNVQFVYI